MTSSLATPLSLFWLRNQHAMWSSPRSGARFNRACVRRALASLSTTALIFLQRGGAKPPTSMAWCRASCAADSASRIPPLSFNGDKRGCMRQFHEAVVSCNPSKKYVLNSAGMTFRLEQGLKNQNRFQLSIGAKTSALEVSERVQALTRVAGRGMSPGRGVVVPTRIVNSSSWRASHFRLTWQSWWRILPTWRAFSCPRFGYSSVCLPPTPTPSTNVRKG